MLKNNSKIKSIIDRIKPIIDKIKPIIDKIKPMIDKNLLSIMLVFFVLIVIEYILSSALNHNVFDKNSTVSNHYLNDFVMTKTDKNGQLYWTLNGVRLEKFPNNPRSEVWKPEMRIQSTETESWTIVAEHALDPDSFFKSIYLTGNVIFDKFDSNNDNEAQIRTSTAIIYPNKEIIETEKFATIITPNSTTTGEGVIADLKNGYIKILSKAKRISYTDKGSEQLQGEKMIYNLEKKTWVLFMKETNDKSDIKERVKTILKTKKTN